MATEQRMRAAVMRAAAALLLSCTLVGLGCGSTGARRLPSTTAASYHAGRDLVWAVAPLVNESGTSTVDALAVTDALAQRIQRVHGLSAVPLDRTLRAMRGLGSTRLDTPAQARELARALGADAIVVGAVTAYGPYDPLQIGLALALYPVSDASEANDPGSKLDPRALAAAPTDYTLPANGWAPADAPASAFAHHYDAGDFELQIAVRAFAEGRHEPTSPMGWKRFMASMPLFTQFACHHATERLLIQEARRIDAVAAAADEP